MPYIPPSRRQGLEHIVDEIRDSPLINTPGDLNYLISCLCKRFIELEGGTSYHTINSAIGALECAKLELYRRIAAPYEDGKIIDNGDIYTVQE